MADKPGKAPETLLGIEAKAFTEKIKQLLDMILNSALALTRKASRTRQTLFVFLLFLLGLVIGFRVVPWSEWLAAVQSAFISLFTINIQAISNSITALLLLVWRAFFSRETLKFLPVFLTPFFLALHFASVYLQDIFELEHVSIARRFILRAAFGTSYERIHIREGDIAEEDKSSPLYLIGGPGLVQVELDSAALFEDADGRPRVIGPTIATGFIELTGFERLREAYDIRDHFTKPLSVGGRTLDGITIAAQDVRLVYSVWRGEKPEPPTLEKPYPFEQKAIETLTYNQSYSVTPGAGSASKGSLWYTALPGIIRGKLGGFISSRRLVEFLASINVPEIQKAEIHDTRLIERAENIAEAENGQSPPNPLSRPDFQPRDKISNMFARFAEEFTEAEQKKGVELHWIGVGTWQPPDEVNAKAIAEKHLEAWKISRDNAGRGNPGAMDGINREASLQETLRLIQEVPINSFNREKTNHPNIQEISGRVLEDYLKQLELAIQKYEAKASQQRKENKTPEPTPMALLNAATLLRDLIWAGTHPVGRSSRQSTFERFTEQQLYDYLVQLVGGNRSEADKLIDEERIQRPGDERKAWITRAMGKILRDRGEA